MSSKVEVSRPANAKKQLVRFIVVGVFCAVLDFGLTHTLTRVVGYDRLVAKVFGWCLGTLVAYLLNSKYTFQAKVTGKRALAVFILYASTFGVQWVLFAVTNAPLRALGFVDPWKDAVSFVIAQGVATITNFVLQRVLIFREPSRVVIEEEPR
ncbi:GtrA family protein [Corynebacterium sp. p3-SID1194]|uniref:GtrA family protein n=1 Tax=Corynebacterium sp. p3-SID1194 TaxID=2916105 RepID=UPI0021A78BC5|nr:GtrA family protein [Corynebacterium sp. p3-SID1194]MCT1450897.1 GtrA family protein [Corynebacterium sp. p3-SID1194]